MSITQSRGATAWSCPLAVNTFKNIRPACYICMFRKKSGSPIRMTCNENVTSTSRYDARQKTNKTRAPTICLLAAKGKQIRDGANCVHPVWYMQLLRSKWERMKNRFLLCFSRKYKQNWLCTEEMAAIATWNSKCVHITGYCQTDNLSSFYRVHSDKWKQNGKVMSLCPPSNMSHSRNKLADFNKIWYGRVYSRTFPQISFQSVTVNLYFYSAWISNWTHQSNEHNLIWQNKRIIQIHNL